MLFYNICIDFFFIVLGKCILSAITDGVVKLLFFVFFPYNINIYTTDLFILYRKWIVDAYNYWDDIRISSNAPLAGVTQISGYIFSNIGKHVVRVRIPLNIYKYINIHLKFI